ncbi:MAG: hypothetical protein KAT70_09635 [Thermoplasmata archaeon]|nr:hypothetical protein [Thermoplasmata archaeon]
MNGRDDKMESQLQRLMNSGNKEKLYSFVESHFNHSDSRFFVEYFVEEIVFAGKENKPRALMNWIPRINRYCEAASHKTLKNNDDGIRHVGNVTKDLVLHEIMRRNANLSDGYKMCSFHDRACRFLFHISSYLAVTNVNPDMCERIKNILDDKELQAELYNFVDNFKYEHARYIIQFIVDDLLIGGGQNTFSTPSEWRQIIRPDYYDRISKATSLPSVHEIENSLKGLEEMGVLTTNPMQDRWKFSGPRGCAFLYQIIKYLDSTSTLGHLHNKCLNAISRGIKGDYPLHIFEKAIKDSGLHPNTLEPEHLPDLIELLRKLFSRAFAKDKVTATIKELKRIYRNMGGKSYP